MPFYPMSLSDVLKQPTFRSERLGDGFDAVVKSVIRQCSTALSYVHSHGVGHRDIKPANFLLGPDGHLVLIDFGIAYDAAHPPATEVSGHLIFDVGTGSYKPPEVLFGSRDYDATRLDLWALGVTLAELFCAIEHKPVADDTDWRFGDGRSMALKPTFMISKTWQRSQLFEEYVGDIALVGRMFRVLGTPTVETWPEARTLPDWGKIHFKTFEKGNLGDRLPQLPSSELRQGVVSLLSSLLVFSAAARPAASSVAALPWLELTEEDAQTAAREIRKMYRCMQ